MRLNTGVAHGLGGYGSFVLHADIELLAVPASVGVARRFTRSTLREWQLSVLAEDAELMVSELVTNAVIHARTALIVVMEVRARTLHVGVHDDSLRAPRAPRYSTLATTGRGLGIVDALASDTGLILESTGKTVWFELATPEGWRV